MIKCHSCIIRMAIDIRNTCHCSLTIICFNSIYLQLFSCIHFQACEIFNSLVDDFNHWVFIASKPSAAIQHEEEDVEHVQLVTTLINSCTELRRTTSKTAHDADSPISSGSWLIQIPNYTEFF